MWIICFPLRLFCNEFALSYDMTLQPTSPSRIKLSRASKCVSKWTRSGPVKFQFQGSYNLTRFERKVFYSLVLDCIQKAGWENLKFLKKSKTILKIWKFLTIWQDLKERFSSLLLLLHPESRVGKSANSKNKQTSLPSSASAWREVTNINLLKIWIYTYIQIYTCTNIYVTANMDNQLISILAR